MHHPLVFLKIEMYRHGWHCWCTNYLWWISNQIKAKVHNRKNSIDCSGDIHFFSKHNFWTTCHRTMIKAYSDSKVSTLNQNMFLSLFSYVWFRSYVSTKSGFPLAYLSRFHDKIESKLEVYLKIFNVEGLFFT